MKMSDKIELNRARARAALDAYRKSYGDAEADPDDLGCIGDLAADLLHLADEIRPGDGFDGTVAPNEQLAYTALENYRYERDPENAEAEV